MSKAMPAVFFGHGSPMNALEENRYSLAWRAFGETLPARPRAIVCISAHWYEGYTAVTAMKRPRTIHDFFGFPQALFDVEYPAPGDPALAEELRDLVKPTHVGLDVDSWGLDHGTWSVLVHAFPDADIPVIQLSLDARKDFEHHVQLGMRLAALRERDVMIVGSGNVVHNLRKVRWGEPDMGFDWAKRFNEAARQQLIEAPSDAARLREHPDFSMAAPTDEHFLPILYLAGLSAAANRPLEVLVDGYSMGSLSMDCYALGGECPQDAGEEPAAVLPKNVPPEDTNT
jgi:4,5-DOPA dioxygenase extradiol